MQPSDAPAGDDAFSLADSSLVVLYDPAAEDEVRERLLPLLADFAVEAQPFVASAPPDLPAGTVVITYLGDRLLGVVLGEAVRRRWRIGILPHKGLVQGRSIFGLAATLSEAVEDIVTAERTVSTDLLLCSGRAVLDKVIVGDASAMVTVPEDAGRIERLVHVLRMLRLLPLARLRPLRLTTQSEKTLDTAVLGLLAAEGAGRSRLLKHAFEGSGANDGMLQALIFAPQSISDILLYLLQSLRKPRKGVMQLPRFTGRVRSESLLLESPRAMPLAVDGDKMTAREIELQLVPHAFALVPGRHLVEIGGAVESKEAFRVQHLPVGETRDELVQRPLPWRRRAATEEFKELFMQLRESARLSGPYLTLMVLSTLLATFGLFAGSSPVIIGAMILAPLMAPIISLAMGALRQDIPLMEESGRTLVLGVLTAVGFATFLTWVTPLQTSNPEISSRVNPTLLDLGVAVIAGIAGAYAHARASVARSLAGVAIAVALVPPLAVTGIGLGWLDFSVFGGAFLLFLTNLAGIVLAAAMTFLWLGFSPFHRAKRGLIISIVFVAVVSIPLGLGFNRMVDEHRIMRLLDGWKVADVELRDVSVRDLRLRSGLPVHISFRLLSRGPIDTATIDTLKEAIEERLERPVRLEVVVAIVRD